MPGWVFAIIAVLVPIVFWGYLMHVPPGRVAARYEALAGYALALFGMAALIAAIAGHGATRVGAIASLLGVGLVVLGNRFYLRLELSNMQWFEPKKPDAVREKLVLWADLYPGTPVMLQAHDELNAAVYFNGVEVAVVELTQSLGYVVWEILGTFSNAPEPLPSDRDSITFTVNNEGFMNVQATTRVEA